MTDSKTAIDITVVSGRSLTDDCILELEIDNGIITKVTKKEVKGSEQLPYIAPGLIDNQVNGFKNVDFTDFGLTVEQIQFVTKELWKEGITSYLPTIITCDPSILKSNLKTFAEALNNPQIGKSIPGIHLEGPYISPLAGFRGAHNKKWTKEPDWKEFNEFQKISGNNVKQITLAPERKGALEFIEKANKRQVVIAIGHHNASANVIHQAAEAGATISTHLGNGCANKIDRHHNPIWPQLAEDRLMASIITDGFHLTQEEIKTFYRAKGHDRLILVSDMTKLAGLPAGDYMWNGKKVNLNRSGKITYPEQNVLAGSSATLKNGIPNMIQFSGCPIKEAFQMATKNPAKLNSLDDRGELSVGKRADCILFNYDGNEIQVVQTIVDGKLVYDQSQTDNFEN